MPPPPHPTLLPLGFSEPAIRLRSPTPKNIIALISIHGTYESPLDSTLLPPGDLTIPSTPFIDRYGNNIPMCSRKGLPGRGQSAQYAAALL